MDDESSTTPIINTPCNHSYHRACLTRWVIHSPTCPTCRGAIVPVTENPWESMSLYDRISNFLLLAIMADTYSMSNYDTNFTPDPYMF
jgi:hypothetical protein